MVDPSGDEGRIGTESVPAEEGGPARHKAAEVAPAARDLGEGDVGVDAEEPTPAVALDGTSGLAGDDAAHGGGGVGGGDGGASAQSMGGGKDGCDGEEEDHGR